MAPKNKFQDGEQVLCFHGPLLYEAKCVKAEIKDKITRYFVHYSGWNKSWDEWVPENRILKFNEQGLQKQKELKQAHLASKKKAKKDREKEKEEREKEKAQAATSGDKQDKSKSKEKAGRETQPVEPEEVVPPVTEVRDRAARRSNKGVVAEKEAEPAAKKKRTRADATVEQEETFINRLEVRIKLPDDLKPWLVDDWDLVTRQKQLVNVPCKKTVDDILDEYVKQRLAKDKHINRDALLEVSQGIREYFNVMLGTQLLYKFERPQYSEVLKDHADTPMSKVYGATHLLRLFVKLGSMLAFTTLEEKTMQLLMSHINDFLKYLHKNSAALFNLRDYMVAPPEYQRKAIT